MIYIAPHLLGQDVHPLPQESRQDEPEGVHGREGLVLLLLAHLGLGPDGSDRVAGAGEDRLVQRVRPGEDQNLTIFSPNVKCWVPLL